MDSPLLPTFRQNPNLTSSSPSNLLSDLSLADPLSPSDSYEHAQSSNYQRRRANSHEEADDGEDGDEETPQKPAATKGRFSLYPQKQQDHISGSSRSSRLPSISKDQGSDEDAGGTDERPERNFAASQGQSSSESNEQLRESLYELKQMNEVFDGFLGALEASRGHNVRLQDRVRETSELLDRYIALLGQTEHNQKMILNPKWTGAEDDAEALEDEERNKKAAEEAAAAEVARKAEAARLAEERKAQAAEKAKELGSLGRGRGRGISRGGSVRGRGAAVSGTSRTTSSARTNSTSNGPPTGIRKPSDGLAGKYANVKSSGYGPTRKPT